MPCDDNMPSIFISMCAKRWFLLMAAGELGCRSAGLTRLILQGEGMPCSVCVVYSTEIRFKYSGARWLGLDGGGMMGGNKLLPTMLMAKLLPLSLWGLPLRASTSMNFLTASLRATIGGRRRTGASCSAACRAVASKYLAGTGAIATRAEVLRIPEI